jgi:hypothetical protein
MIVLDKQQVTASYDHKPLDLRQIAPAVFLRRT